MIIEIFRENYIIALAADDLAYIMFSNVIFVQGSTRKEKIIFPWRRYYARNSRSYVDHGIL